LRVGALLLAGGERDDLRRRRLQGPVGRRQQTDRDQRERAGGDEQVADGLEGDSDEAGHARLQAARVGAATGRDSAGFYETPAPADAVQLTPAAGSPQSATATPAGRARAPTPWRSRHDRSRRGSRPR